MHPPHRDRHLRTRSTVTPSPSFEEVDLDAADLFYE